MAALECCMMQNSALHSSVCCTPTWSFWQQVWGKLHLCLGPLYEAPHSAYMPLATLASINQLGSHICALLARRKAFLVSWSGTIVGDALDHQPGLHPPYQHRRLLARTVWVPLFVACFVLAPGLPQVLGSWDCASVDQSAMVWNRGS